MLPLLYHTHHIQYKDDIPFWLDLAARQGSPVLELGCGTGRVLAPLALAGYDVYGLDRDPAMLSVLRQNLASDLKRYINLVQADLTAFHLNLDFGLILLPCNTFSTLAEEDRKAALKRIFLHLRAGGLFAVSLPNPRLLARLRSASEPEIEDVFFHPVDGEPVQVSSSWKRTRQHFTVYWHYDHLLPDGRVQRVSTQISHHLVAEQDYIAEIQTTGFEEITLYGDFNRSPFTNDSPYLILLAKAGGSF